MTNDDRYDEIMRRIARRQAEAAGGPHYETLSAALDDLNAIGFLEDHHWRHHAGIVCFGPQAVRGLGPPVWVGAALWYKSSNYYDHLTLHLLGVWALSGEPITIAVGVKVLEYNAPVYVPEAVYHHLKRGFDRYYTGDASPPPPDAWRYSTAYDRTRRLAQRRELGAVLDDWSKTAEIPR